MAPARRRSRPSDSSTRRDDASRGTKIPLKGSPRTPHHRSPIKKRKNGISLQQKQALIDNLQLEVTERARRLRAQYNLQAQGLRSRVEIRVNRIPRSLRKLKMGDLLLKHLEQEQSRAAAPPPVKEAAKPATRSQVPERVHHAVGTELARDKENEGASLKGKKKTRGPDVGTVRPTQVLSPTSSNSRLATRHSPPKTQIAQPGSPLKTSGTGRTAAVSGVLSSMVERAKATRYGSTRKPTAASSRSSSTTAATRARRLAAKPLPPAATRPVTRARASGTSESSEGSTTTVVRKAATNTAAVAAAAASKKRTMGVIRKGVTGGGMKKAAPKPAAPASKTTGRSLRKRT
ncbi:hypothetical protein L249_6525 [Ophiocordyceps polyrhachis-furcata BCC 54312]|uniref:Borealin N-terminal domain-containing protein n=1 Tax=Ophiocordyceps polyrhachis-furcata BCC 54312 TaxID=1330021 RepID=A0A367LLM3_9HYPO|nr:hypothetical protein L249_6525 [Ophiocordyceps polyrhachis-furcata BCC 54312]